MTSPAGDSTSVHYTATATFAQLIAEANKAERALRDLERAEKDLGNTASAESRRVASAAKDRADAIKSSQSGIDRAIASNDKYAKSFDAINKKLSDSKKSFSDLERVAKTFASTNDDLAASFDRLNRAQSGSGRDNFASNTRKSVDEASTAIQDFENRLKALFASASNQAIELNVNAESALNEIAKVAAEIQLLTRGVNEVEIRINTNKTLLEVRRVSRAIKKELGESIDADALGQSASKFREIARDIAADAAEFRREQSRLDRELLEDQLDLEARLASSNRSASSESNRAGDRSDLSFAAEISDILEENRASLRSISDSLDNSLTNFASKFDELRGSTDATQELAEAIRSSGEGAEDSGREIDRLTKSLEDLEKREIAIAAQEDKLSKQRLSNAEKERLARRAADVDDLKGKALETEARRLDIRGRSGMRVDQLREAIKENYLRPTVAEETRARAQADLAEQRARLAKEIILARAAVKEQADIRAAQLKKEAADYKALLEEQTDARRQADKVEIADKAITEAKRREELRKSQKEADRLYREQIDNEKEVDRLIRDIEKERAAARQTLAKRDSEDVAAGIKNSLKRQPEQEIIDDIRGKSEDKRTNSEKEVLAIIDRLKILKREIKSLRADAEVANETLRALATSSARFREDRDLGLPVDKSAGDRTKSNLSSVRYDSDLASKDILAAIKLREREELSLLATVQRIEREKTAARNRASLETEREAKRSAKELERISKLPASEQFKLWARDAVQSIALVALNTEKGAKQIDRLRKFSETLREDDGSGRFKTDDSSQRSLERLRTTYIRLQKEIDAGEHSAGRFRATAARIAEIFRNDVRGNFFTNVARGLSQLGDVSTDALKKLTKVSGELYRMPGIILLLISSISGLIAGLGAAAGGFIGLANAAASALGVLAAAPGLVAAIGSAFGAVTLGSKGIGDVFAAARAGQDEAAKAKKDKADGGDSISAARQQRAAARGLRDAYESLTDAQKDQQDAQKDVAKAWRQAKEDLIDLQFTVRQGVIDEERAIIALRKARLELARIQAGGSEDPEREKEALLRLQEARREYNKILADGNSTAIERAKVLRRVSEAEIRYAEATRSKTKPGDRQEAELDIKDAQLALERIRNTNKRNQDELSKIQKEGLGSTDRVVNANDRLAAATERVADAQEAIIEAQQRVKEVNEDSAKGADKVAAASDKLEAELDKLGPKTRIVVEAMLALIPAYDKMQDRIGDRLFGPISDDTGLFVDVLEIMETVLGRAADAMGYLLEKGLKLVTSGPWKRDFGTIADSNYRIIKNLGVAFFDIADSFRNITVAAGPFTEWLTQAFAGAAKNFKIWSETARANGTIAKFLEDSKETLKTLAKIFGNVRDIAISYYKATKEQGDYILDRIKLMTDRWKAVAKEQEAAGSGLQTFLRDSRPALSALASLIGAIGSAFAEVASRPENLQAAVDIFTVLKDDVLPPIVDFLNALSDSDIAPKIAKAIGDIIDALAQFIESGGGDALAQYFETLAFGIGLLTDLVTLPGVKQVFGALAVGLATLAAAATVAKFLGIFKLFEFFQWVVKNRKKVTDSLDDMGKSAGKAGDESSKNKRDFPDVDDFSDLDERDKKKRKKSDDDIDVDLDDLEKDTKRVKDGVDDVDASADKLKGTGGKLKGALGSLGSALGGLAEGFGAGGYVGLAIAAATVTAGFYISRLEEAKERVDDLKDGLLGVAKAIGATGTASQQAIEDVLKDNPKLTDFLTRINELPNITGASSGTAISGLNGDPKAARQTIDAYNDAINDPSNDTKEILGGVLDFATYGKFSTPEFEKNKQLKEDRAAYRAALQEADKQREADDKAAEAARNYAKARRDALLANSEYATASPALRGELEKAADKTLAFGDAMAVIADPLSTVADKMKAVEDATHALYGEAQSSIEQEDRWEDSLLNLKEAVDAGGKSLNNKTREGQRNREEIKRLATQTKNFYLEDIANGVSQEEATERHRLRTEALKKQLTQIGLNKEETGNLIKIYGDIPSSVLTDFKLLNDDTVKNKIISVLALLLHGKNSNLSIAQAETEIRRDVAQADRASGSGKTPYIYTEADKKRLGLAQGGFVSGPGGPRDDMIQAWLSNREFVQPADATEHYGVPFMEKLRRKQIPKQAVQNLDGQMYASGGHVSSSCNACASGHGHAKFANGGMVTWPFQIDANKKFDINSWIDQSASGDDTGILGDNVGSIGYRWQMQALRKVFPGLDLISGFRPGSRTSNGSLSWHARGGGRAVDIPPRQDVFNWIVANYGKRTKELIWGGDPNRNIYEGKNYRFSDTLLSQHGPYRGRPGPSPHIHWAFKDGGLVDDVLGNLMSLGGASKPLSQVNARPTPRVLSPAAQSVINNNENETSYNITVNNPVPERAGDSIKNSLARTVYMYGN